MGAEGSVPEKKERPVAEVKRANVDDDAVARAIAMHRAACRIQAVYRGKRDRTAVTAIVVEKRRSRLSQGVSGFMMDASEAVHDAAELAEDLADEAAKVVRQSVHLTQDEVEDRTVDLEAMHTMGLLFPLIGISMASWSAASFYFDDPQYILNGTTDSRFYDYTADQEIKEPFATMCNLCYIVSGFSYFLVQFLSGGAMPEQTYGLGIMLLLEGAGSFAFHRNGSRTGRGSTRPTASACTSSSRTARVSCGMARTTLCAASPCSRARSARSPPTLRPSSASSSS